MKPDYPRIAALEQVLGIAPSPEPVAEMPGYVVLKDSKGEEASDRVRVTFALAAPRREAGMTKIDIVITDGPITLKPTRYCLVHAVAVFDQGGEMPACSPDLQHYIEPGWEFRLTP